MALPGLAGEAGKFAGIVWAMREEDWEEGSLAAAYLDYFLGQSSQWLPLRNCLDSRLYHRGIAPTADQYDWQARIIMGRYSLANANGWIEFFDCGHKSQWA